MPDEPTMLTAALRRALVPALGEVVIEDLRRLTGGASRETWSFDASDSSGVRHELLLRRDFPGGATQNPDALAGRADALDRAGEYALLETLQACGLPVPRPLALPEEQPLQHSFIMERVAGESRPHVIVREHGDTTGEDSLAARLGAALAAVHALGAGDLPPIPRRDWTQKLEVVRALLDRGPARPALELALRWCADNAPADRELRLVHGDYRTANYILGADGRPTIIDWEFAHLGDPHEDLAFLCMRAWRFGADEREVSGVGARADLYRGYERAGGAPIDPAALHHADVLAHLFTGAVFMMRAVQFQEGSERSLEGAAIGRRVAEIEYDMLELLD
jgi:aminoglycoside phosphotransferase (APT) family kinase protein